MRPVHGSLAVALLAVLATSCGGDGESSEADYAVVPTSAVIGADSEQQFSVDGDEEVLWGLAPSGNAPAPAPQFPLKVAPNGRYLVDQDDRPWRINADSAWLMSSEATAEQVTAYLDTRKAQGFNSYYLMAAVHPGGYEEASHSPNNREGAPPFATPNDFSTAGATPESERYWEWIDWIVAQSAERDMVVMLAYSYLGWQGGEMGWWQPINEQDSRDVLYDWGVWLGERYGDDANVIWFGLGDYTPPPGSEGALRVRAIAEGIKSTGAPQPFMAEPSPPDELPVEVPEFGDLLDMNSFYGYGPEGRGMVYVTANEAWNVAPAKPAWMQEGTYEYENNYGSFSAEPWDTRRGRFWSVLAGGTAGDGFGSKDVWRWQNIPESLTSPGADYSTYSFELFESMPWWDLVPADPAEGGAGQLVVAGRGTWGEADYVTAARTTDGSWLLAYVPVTEQGVRTLTIDMTALSGPARARWFDPATGNYLAIADGEDLPNIGTHEFTTPDQRGDGTDDWLLVLDVDGPSPCGTITADGAYRAPSTASEGVTCEVTATLVEDPAVIARAVLVPQ